MSKTFQHLLQTGSGTSKINLTIDEFSGQLDFDVRWMGSNLPRYRIGFRHTRFSEHYGVLHLDQVDRYLVRGNAETVTEPKISELVIVPEFEGEIDEPYVHDYLITLNDLAYEYICLPKSEPWLADDVGLQQIKETFNLAQWNETFDLFLWMRRSNAFDPDNEWRDANLREALIHLDKLKFALL